MKAKTFHIEHFLIVHFDVYLQFPEGDSAPRAPPASKEVVAKLPVITITNEILAKLGPDAECAICKENLVVDDNMQEMPCKHTFHPPCLKPWLVSTSYTWFTHYPLTHW